MNNVLKEIANKLRQTGYIGGKVILLHTKDLPIEYGVRSVKYYKDNIDCFKELNSMRNITSRLGYSLLEYYYEDITNKKGNGCIEDALKIIFSNNMIPCTNIYDKEKTAVACIGFRGMRGKPNLYFFGDNPYMRLADGYCIGNHLVKYDRNTDSYIKIC